MSASTVVPHALLSSFEIIHIALTEYLRSQSQCTQCGVEINAEHRTVAYNGKLWHPECFV